jgi:hypothetical protein
MPGAVVVDWNQPLVERRLQVQNARDSLERSNLFFLLRETPAEPQKGGASESVNVLAQYLHLRKETHESELHFFVGSALRDLLKYRQFPGLIGVETEEPFIPGRTDPVPDIYRGPNCLDKIRPIFRKIEKFERVILSLVA